MVTQIPLKECVRSDRNSFCHLICCYWSSSGMRENDVYIQNDTKARLYCPHSARLPLINLTVEGSWGASWACFEAVMLDSLKRTAGMMSTQWQSKQRFQTSLSLTCVVAKAEMPGLVLTYTPRLNGSLIDQRSGRWRRIHRRGEWWPFAFSFTASPDFAVSLTSSVTFLWCCFALDVLTAYKSANLRAALLFLASASEIKYGVISRLMIFL